MRIPPLALVAVSFALPHSLPAQTVESSRVQLVIPQSRGWSRHADTRAVQVTSVDANVTINEQIAKTTITVHLKNPGRRQLEAEILLPVPAEVVVRGFTFQGSASEPTAELLPRDEARRIYNGIVSKLRDPALLEFAGYQLVKSSVFPVPAGGTQKVRITYEQLLPAEGNRVDYVLPRSQSVENSVPWNISVSVKSKRDLSTVYSPSHRVETKRAGSNAVGVNVASSAAKEPGAFRLSYLHNDGDVSASMLAYPDPSIKGGYFLLLAGLPSQPADAKTIKREVTIVLDRSGSMNGQKIKQVRESVRQVIAGLEDGEAFNIIVYNEAVDVFSEKPVIKSDKTETEAFEYLDSIRPRGGTNIHDALLESLRQKPADGMLPIVLFLTDGLPTIGRTSEKVIRDVATNANPFKRRVFTFGVGVDVNTPLLEGIADRTRARSTFVLPEEDVELKVAQVFKRLSGPILADTQIEVFNADRSSAKSRIHDLLPSRLPDLYRDDQLVLVGQYRDDEPLTFDLKGNYLGEQKTFRFDFKMDKATTRNAFVSRLWASRKIAVLIDAVRQLGATSSPLASNRSVLKDPRAKELIEEIVKLSTEFGVLTEYTAFLAREGSDFSRRLAVLACEESLSKRAVGTRSGLASVNQTLNLGEGKNRVWANPSNKYIDQNLKVVEITSVQQVNDRCYLCPRKEWIDGKLAYNKKKEELKANREIDFGSPEFFKLVTKLSKANRQGELALYGNILMQVDGEMIRVKNPARRVAGK